MSLKLTLFIFLIFLFNFSILFFSILAYLGFSENKNSLNNIWREIFVNNLKYFLKV